MLLGVSSHAVGEFVVAHDVNFGAIGKKSVVEGIHLLLKLIGERMTVLHRHKAVLVLGFVAAENQEVVDTEEIEVDKRIFGFRFRETAANDVRHGRHAIFLLNCSSYGNGQSSC